MTLTTNELDIVVRALRTVLADDQVLTSKTDRYNRCRVPAPFPGHHWAERVPDLAVLPTSTEQVAGVVRIANDLRLPVVPHDGGTGLSDGAPTQARHRDRRQADERHSRVGPGQPYGHRRCRHQHDEAQRATGPARIASSR